MQKISNAVVIMGPGRSGTTLLYNILALHPDLGWISSYTNRYPQHPVLSCFNRIQDCFFIERLNRGKRKWPRPAEAYSFWGHFFSDFWSRSPDCSVDNDDSAKRCIQRIRLILRYSGKKRFITKITGVPSIAVIRAVFDDPSILYIDRDPRAVTMSYYKQRWGYKDNPEAFRKKETKELIREYCDRYMFIYEKKETLKVFDFKHVRYEDMVQDPTAFFEDVLSSLSLEFSASFRRLLDSWRILRGTNDAWKKLLGGDDVLYLNTLLRLPIAELGYSRSQRAQLVLPQSEVENPEL